MRNVRAQPRLSVLGTTQRLWTRGGMGLPLRGQKPARLPPNLSPQLMNERREEDQIPSPCLILISARRTRQAISLCLFAPTRLHTEHSSWEGCAPEKLQSLLLFLGRRGEFPDISSTSSSLTCCLSLSCLHMNVQMRQVSAQNMEDGI